MRAGVRHWSQCPRTRSESHLGRFSTFHPSALIDANFTQRATTVHHSPWRENEELHYFGPSRHTVLWGEQSLVKTCQAKARPSPPIGESGGRGGNI